MKKQELELNLVEALEEIAHASKSCSASDLANRAIEALAQYRRSAKINTDLSEPKPAVGDAVKSNVVKSDPEMDHGLKEHYRDIIDEWRSIWMNQTQNNEEDRKNYFRRAIGVDSNMQYSLARMLADDFILARSREADKVQADRGVPEANRILAEYAKPNSLVDEGNLYYAATIYQSALGLERDSVAELVEAVKLALDQLEMFNFAKDSIRVDRADTLLRDALKKFGDAK